MKKVLLLSMVLVLCLAAAGIGYAHWTKTLYVDGTVTTGTFGVEWSQLQPTDNEDTKDVGVASCYFVGDTVFLEIVNAYPSYEATFVLDIHGLGTVPAHVKSIAVTSADPFLDVQVAHELLPIQLHMCQETLITVTIHVLQELVPGGDVCPQGATLMCSLQVVADQFNA